MELHKEFRPQNFDEVIGNKKLISIIESKLQKDENDKPVNFPHAVMIHGPKGSGKTTLARIISKELGCDPEAKSTDYQEFDLVQCGGIDAARSIRENICYSPMDQKARVYIFDEMQDSSAKFQAGLLKILEDGAPDWAYFIICTTDPQKINNPLKSRCAKYKVSALNDDEMFDLLDWVLNKLNDDQVSDDVIDKIIETAEGCPRECLVLLDSIISLPANEQLEAIQGGEVTPEIRDLCKAMLKGANWKQLSKMLKPLKGIDAEGSRYQINGWFSSVALNNYNAGDVDRAAYVFECFRESVMYTKFPGLVFAVYATTL